MNCFSKHNTRQAGFTLPEALLSGVLGAMLLTALAYASAEFALGIGHLEAKAGIGQTEDGVLRQMTQDIREAWWAELPSDDHLKLADPDGQLTEYFLSNGDLKLRRPNGDTAVIFYGLADLVIEPSHVTRHRNGALVPHNGSWYASAPSGASFNLHMNGSEDSLALAFVAPYEEGDLPGGSGTDEHLATVGLSAAQLPIAFIPGTLAESVQVDIFATRGPGSADPVGAVIASLLVDGTSLPQAVWDTDHWEVVSGNTTLDLSSLALSLNPGDSYAMVLTPTNDAGLLSRAVPMLPSYAADDVDIKSGVGGSYVTSPVSVPFSLSGNYDLTTTVVHGDVISGLSVVLTPVARPLQHRSASLLSQSLTSDPWFGVVPGEIAP